MLIQGTIGQFALGQGPALPPYAGVDWSQQWPEPVLTMRKSVAAGSVIAGIASGLTMHPFPLPNSAQLISQWGYALSEPVRIKPGLISALQTPGGQFPQTAKETVSVDRWNIALSEPVRVNPGIAAASQSVLAFVEAAPFPEKVSVDRWNIALSEPVRVRPALAAAQQDWGGRFPQTAKETVSIDRWMIALSEPVRVKPGLPAGEQTYAVLHPQPVVSFAWFNWLHDPVRIPQALLTDNQSTEVLTEAAPFPESIGFDKWGYALSEPVRVPARLTTAAQSFFTTSPTSMTVKETVSEDRWHQPWTNPPVMPNMGAPKLGAQHMQFVLHTIQNITPEQTFSSKWFVPLSEPVRIKPGLIASEQSVLTEVEAAPFPETVSYDKWGYAISEPVRFKLELRAQYQIAFTPSPQWYGTARTRTYIIS